MRNLQIDAFDQILDQSCELGANGDDILHIVATDKSVNRPALLSWLFGFGCRIVVIECAAFDHQARAKTLRLEVNPRIGRQLIPVMRTKLTEAGIAFSGSDNQLQIAREDELIAVDILGPIVRHWPVA